jgi:hypothetical protein
MHVHQQAASCYLLTDVRTFPYCTLLMLSVLTLLMLLLLGLSHQVPKHAAYLETALQLANNSLAASMYYLNSAYLLSDDPAAASAALDVAELHLAHTLRRTKMAVRMAAAIKSAEQQQHGQLFAACLQQQQLVQLQAQYMQTEDGEEVSSRWHPSTPQAACMQ